MGETERINEAYRYLQSKGIVRTQKEVAEKMGASTSNVSSALKGVDSVLTDRFLVRFNKAFGGLFNQTWLLTGEGEMINRGSVSQNANGDSNTQVAGNGNNVNTNDILQRAFDEIAAQRKLTEKAQENIAQLTEALLKLTNKSN